MTGARLDALLARFARLRVAVLGDFFVDKYLLLDPALAEISLETGLEAHQVVGVRCQPGAAGTVTNNLSALGLGTILAVGCVGEDGEGYELRRALAATRVDTDRLLTAPGRFTPTYTKPLVVTPDAPPRELNRLDIKNRQPVGPALEAALLAQLDAVVDDCDALLVLDQVTEANHGVVTDRVRARLGELSRQRPNLVVLADSRAQIGRFTNVSVKPNADEARAAFALAGHPGELAAALSRRMGRPAFVTRGEHGAVAAADGQVWEVPGVPVTGPVDIVGAGDSFAAATASALAAGATAEEAAELGCLVASITVQQLGTTGTATPAQVRARWREL